MCFWDIYMHIIARKRHSLQSMCHIVDMHVVCVVLADDERRRFFFFFTYSTRSTRNSHLKIATKTDRTQNYYTSFMILGFHIYVTTSTSNRMYQYPQFSFSRHYNSGWTYFSFLFLWNEQNIDQLSTIFNVFWRSTLLIFVCIFLGFYLYILIWLFKYLYSARVGIEYCILVECQRFVYLQLSL